MAMQFTRWEDMTPEEQAAVAEMGRRGQVVIREQKRSISSYGLLRPAEAERAVAARIPYVFNNHHHTQAWKRKGIRPETGSAHPERTDERYCIYHHLSRSYGYTQKWVDWLVRHCSTERQFEETTGRSAVAKGDVAYAEITVPEQTRSEIVNEGQ